MKRQIYIWLIIWLLCASCVMFAGIVVPVPPDMILATQAIVASLILLAALLHNTLIKL